MAGKTFKARLEPGGREFILHPGESVLNCALRQRILLQYGCRNGRCSSCKYFLIDGEVDFGNISSYSLTENEREEGWALLCQARALSDLVIREQPAADRDDAPVITPGERSAEVATARPLSASLWGLQLVPESPLSFYPGQFIEIEIPGRPGSWRCYSIASSPGTPERIELVIKRIADGEFSGRDEHFTTGFKLMIRGPYGMSYLRKSDRPVLLVATGSGLAPMLSIIRSAAAQQDSRSYQFHYGARTESDLIFRDELRLLEQQMAHFSFKPALSAPPAAGDGWRGAAGRVTQVLQREVADASPYDAYICGQPEMCEAVATLLLAKGISEDRIFRDDFFPASD